ncbi:MAG: peptidase M61, partial [Comamonadaceae bacterium]|nr:peptidase M61 [Comamonadaceae bacterium]
APARPHAHQWAVTLTMARPASRQRVALPVWIPGSYLVREFARHLHGLTARQGRTACAVQQIDKCTWEIEADPARPLTLHYEVYAFDPSVRAAWLDGTRGFFNGTALLLRVHGQQDAPHALTLRRPAGAAFRPWQAATSLTPQRVDAAGFGTYQASGYDELADSPVEMGPFWSGQFTLRGVAHRFVVAGAPPAFDGARLLADTRKICEAAMHLWHGARGKPPMRSYVFMLNAVHDGYGGLEHRASTALICARRDLPRQGETAASEGYVTLLGLISHEYFHTWNVKRLRPAEFARYDYTQENYTRLLWFFEGFTSYYDDLLLRRAGLIDTAAYLKLLGKNINQVLQMPGRHVQSVAQASFDAWIKYYRPDENTPNATVSYYTKGALVALCFDLTLRAEGHATLDDVMRALWQRCQGGPMTEDDFAAALRQVGGRDFGAEIAARLHRTDEFPRPALLARHGVALHEEKAPLAQALGLRVNESAGGITLKTVLAGGAAEAAGLAAGDEWLGIEVPASRQSQAQAQGRGQQPASAWRLRQLDDLPLYAGPARQLTALVARDQRLLRLPLTLPARTAPVWRLAPAGTQDEGTAWPMR